MAGSDDFGEDGDNLSYYFEDLKGSNRKLKKKIFDIQKGKAQVKDAEKLLSQTEEAINLFQSSMNQADADQRRTYEHDFERIKKNFKKYKKELDSLKGSSKTSDSKKRDELLSETREEVEEKKKKKKRRDEDDGEDNGKNQKQKKKVDKHTAEVIAIQDESNKILEDMIVLNEDTIQIGTRAAEKLKQQRERIEQIQKEVNEIGTGLKRAKKEMASFYRNIVCSKVIILVVIVILLLAVTAIILRSILEAFGIKVIDEQSIFNNIKKKVKDKIAK